MSDPFNVLISSAGRRVALMGAFRESLAELGVSANLHAADMSPLSAAMQVADSQHLVPACTAPEFIPEMLDICRQNAIRLIVPTIDTELPMYAKHRSEFVESGTMVLVSSPGTVAICADKQRTHDWLVENDLPTVRQESSEDALDDVEAWNFPVIAKPAAGSASIGVRVIESVAELQTLAGKPDYVVQEIAGGDEYTLDVLVDRSGRARCVVPRLRLEVRSGEVSKGVTVRHERLERLGAAICEKLPDAYGVLTVQIFLDRDTDAMNIIEINPRFGGGFPLAFEAGADYPRWIIEEVLAMTSTASAGDWKDRLVMLRYEDAAFVDADEVGLE